MVLLETFGFHLFNCGEIFGTHLGQNSSFSQFSSCKKGLLEICLDFVSFIDISGIRWYELKGFPGILSYNLSVC